MKNKVGLGFAFCTVHWFAGLIYGRSLLSRILGLFLVWEGAVLGLLISLPKQGWKRNRRLTACLISPCPCSRLKFLSSETGSAVPSPVSPFNLQPQDLAVTHGFPSFLPIFTVVSICTANCPRASAEFIMSLKYRWRSLPIVQRHRASSHQSNDYFLFKLKPQRPILVRV